MVSEIQLKDLEGYFARYCEWAHGQGLYPEFDEKFFDWMNNAV